MSINPLAGVWYKRLTPADFFNIERHADAGPAGGGGQTYIDLPSDARDALFHLLQKPLPTSDDWPSGFTIQARAIGNPNLVAPLSFDYRGAAVGHRYKVSNQVRQREDSQRHPAWTRDLGFPTAPDNIGDLEEAAQFVGPGLTIYVARLMDGTYYAGYVKGLELPAGWPTELQPMFTDSTGYIAVDAPADLPAEIGQILDACRRGRNVLIYGPPGTGKTYLMSVLWELIQREGAPLIGLDPSNQAGPFTEVLGELPFPVPVALDWVTFHQSYAYEDFVVGLRPVPQTDGGFVLKPRAGRFLDMAWKVHNSQANVRSGVMMIDEINRANVSRVFGETITFLEDEYRAEDAAGKPGPRSLPFPLASVRRSGDTTEEIDSPSSDSTFKLPAPWYFPSPIWIISSMNSVDRTVAPLDAALARRFERVEVRPNLTLLARWLDVDEQAVAEKVKNHVDASAEGVLDLSASECSYLLLRRLNEILAGTLGVDFELGHAYFLAVAEHEDKEARFRSLANVWDEKIWPQLQDRYLTRPDELIEVVKLNASTPEGYLFSLRKDVLGNTLSGRSIVDVPALSGGVADHVKTTLRHLACP